MKLDNKSKPRRRGASISILEWWGCDDCIYAAAKHNPNMDTPCQQCDAVLENTIFVAGTARVHRTPVPLIKHEGKWPIVLIDAVTEGHDA